MILQVQRKNGIVMHQKFGRQEVLSALKNLHRRSHAKTDRSSFSQLFRMPDSDCLKMSSSFVIFPRKYCNIYFEKHLRIQGAIVPPYATIFHDLSAFLC